MSVVNEEHVREALKQVIDPELFVNIIDLGLVYNVDVQPWQPTDPELAPPEPVNLSTPPAVAPGTIFAPPSAPPNPEKQQAAPASAAESVSPTNPPGSAPPQGAAAPGPPAPAPVDPPAAAEPVADADPTKVKIEMTMTSPACPAGPQLIANSRMVVARLPGVKDVEVKLVMDPPWTPDRMSEDARDQLGIF